jgi:hypothetical protein
VAEAPVLAFVPEPTLGTAAILGPGEFRSPGLRLLWDRLAGDGKHRILDLGEPNGATLRALTEVRCRIYVEDLGHHLLDHPPAVATGRQDQDPEERRRAVEAVVEAALGHPPDSAFDLVLGWDLFNYLDRETITALMGRIAPACRPGALMFLLISNAAEIPSRPGRICLGAPGYARYEPRTGDRVRGPRYTPLGLERMMPGFRLMHSFLLGNGMQDYIFAREGRLASGP